MSHGYAEPKRLLLGGGDLYINDVFVGNLKGAVTFTYAPKYAYQRPGNSIADVKGVRTEEMVTLVAEVCDFKIAQLRRAFGMNESIASGSATLRRQENLKLSSTTNVSLASTAVAGTMKVSKLDRSVAYVSSTDYSATASTIARKSGAITSGQTVIVEYDFLDAAANRIMGGGEKTQPNTFTMEFVHQLSNGKLVQITFYRAMFEGNVALPFHEASTGTFTTHAVTLKALVDVTRANGENMFEIVEEDPLTAS